MQRDELAAHVGVAEDKRFCNHTGAIAKQVVGDKIHRRCCAFVGDGWPGPRKADAGHIRFKR